MSDPEPLRVVDRDGLRGIIEALAPDPRMGNLGPEDRVPIRLANGRLALVPGELLAWQPDGSYRLEASLEEITGALGTGAGERDAAGTLDDGLTIPVIEEQVRIHKREVVSGKVRVRKVVQEREEIVDEPLLREEVEVRRVPLDRWVDGPVSVREEGDTLIIPLLEEVLVVEKRLRLKEEIHITRQRCESRHREQLVLRGEEATVERVNAGAEADEANR
jgi:uncharacterized protein (TIGR02271 family)